MTPTRQGDERLADIERALSRPLPPDERARLRRLYLELTDKETEHAA